MTGASPELIAGDVSLTADGHAVVDRVAAACVGDGGGDLAVVGNTLGGDDGGDDTGVGRFELEAVDVFVVEHAGIVFENEERRGCAVGLVDRVQGVEAVVTGGTDHLAAVGESETFEVELGDAGDGTADCDEFGVVTGVGADRVHRVGGGVPGDVSALGVDTGRDVL